MFTLIVTFALIGVVGVLVYKANKRHANAAAAKAAQAVKDQFKDTFKKL